MGRSLKKGPYVVERLLEKVYRADNTGNRDPIKTWSRACTFVPEFVGKNFAIHNLEMQPGGGAKLCRSAGVSATLTARESTWAQITLPSGEVRRLPATCRATIGTVGNSDHMNIRLGKAGRKRWLGRRPHVRGVAMNPVDHPMGGGEGRTSGGRHPCSPTGKLAKGGKTRRRRKPSNSAIIRRRKSVRYGQLKV